MNPAAELATVWQSRSNLAGAPTDPNSTFPPLTLNYPRLDCTDVRTLDWAVRATMRVRKLRLTVSYDSFVATTVANHDGTPVSVTYAAGPSGTATQDYTAASVGDLFPKPTANLSEADLVAGCVGGYHRGNASTPGLSGGVFFTSDASVEYYVLAAILLNAATPLDGSFPYVFTLSLQTMVSVGDDNGYGNNQYVTSAGTGGAPAFSSKVVIPVRYLGKNFSGLAYHYVQPADFSSGASPTPPETTTTRNTYNATKLEAEATEFWTYDGKYNSGDGSLA